MKKYIFCFLTLCFTSVVVAQNLSQAKKLFDKGEFEKAKTISHSKDMPAAISR